MISDPSDFGIYHSDPTKSTLRDLIDEEPSREFLRWMNGSSKYISTYNEEEKIEDQLEDKEIGLTLEEFTEIREKLIQDKVLLIDYSPHRSSTGNRSSRPARWAYKMTQPVLDNMSEILLENGLPAQ